MAAREKTLGGVTQEMIANSSVAILGIVGRMVITELERRGGGDTETLASIARGNVTSLEQRVERGGPKKKGDRV